MNENINRRFGESDSRSKVDVLNEENNQNVHFTWYQRAKNPDSGGIKNSATDNFRTSSSCSMIAQSRNQVRVSGSVDNLGKRRNWG